MLLQDGVQVVGEGDDEGDEASAASELLGLPDPEEGSGDHILQVLLPRVSI